MTTKEPIDELATLRARTAQLEELVAARTGELQRTVEELRLAKFALEAAVAQLARAVGHELRNPLGAIKNASYLLRLVLPDPDPDADEALAIVEREVQSCGQIIDNLAAFARPPQPAPQQVALHDVVQQALASVATPPGIAVHTELDGGLPQLFLDPQQLARVFAQLVENAFQAMPRGGRLRVRAASAAPEQLEVSFEDTGVGIAPADLPQIFEPLFTRKARGIGFGLPIAKTLLEQNGGAMAVQSTPGQGSCFTVRLPASGGAGHRR